MTGHRTGRMPLDRHIFLIGMPGTGKSTLGHALRRRGYNFTDLDEYVEDCCGCTIAGLVAERGMSEFRRLETDALRRLLAGKPRIIACGGGTPCHDGNLELMQSVGRCVLLCCDRRRHIQRIAQAGGSRPMFAGVCHDPAAIAALLDRIEAERACYYGRADCRFDATRLETHGEIAETTARFICQVLENKQSLSRSNCRT